MRTDLQLICGLGYADLRKFAEKEKFLLIFIQNMIY